MLDSILLEPEQEELLDELVEASRNVPRNQREKFRIFRFMGGSSLQHSGLKGGNKPSPFEGDIETLDREGLIALSHGPKSGISFYVTPRGFKFYELLHQNRQAHTDNVETSIRRFLDSDSFQASYPDAYLRWSEADNLLWESDSNTQFTTIGHLCREALQEFADALVNKYEITDVPDDKAKTVARIRGVLLAKKSVIPRTTEPYLDALLVLWGTTSDLVQRQEHGSQKEGQSLVWEDARRVVFASMMVMFEIEQTVL